MLSTACKRFASFKAVRGLHNAAPIKPSHHPRITQLLIDGKFTDAVSGKTFQTIDPRTEETIVEVAAADKEDVNLAVNAARKAFETGPWRKMSGRERGKILYRLADLMEAHKEELAVLETLDNGKPLSLSRNSDVPLAIDHYRYFAGWADKIHGQTIPVDGPFFAYTLREPVGVVGQIIPWNFPLLMQAWKLGPALAAGNTVVMKLAEQTPLTGLRVGELALEAGMPPGVLNLVAGMGETAGAALCSHMDVDKIAFTGSTEVGHMVMKAAAESNMKKVTLELGGKSPFIICEDADIDRAVSDAHHALFMNHGQCCVAGSRLFVHDNIYDEFVEKSVKLAKKKRVGDPFHPDSEQGPQVSQEQLDRILRYVGIGQEEGASLQTGGARLGTKGYFMEPTVFAEVEDHHTIAKEEIFGPVMSIIRWKTLEEVAFRANNTTYGLAAGIWSSSANTLQYLSRAVKAGTLFVNCYNVFDASLPFGGARPGSGQGRDKGEAALSHYTELKTVIQRLPRNNPYL
ncbi:hypothetical protein NSK_003499 [Nannochloropsis salina CCMP1776]|uniref:Aldehyde dehydrogenase domain-containing protein n=1 Tax=Nannochloropsis salina CCMP1776 TaxID=1027361 RepID=A0A4D9D6J2_9STRA|nr:hypothetical protein NSK_003499 [Nannochloropsis salina CCMP1776]|eukprot:TFJ85075.1 hypothetical protein NSK_003499 [Nannochloropsis salina CCMP1776]